MKCVKLYLKMILIQAAFFCLLLHKFSAQLTVGQTHALIPTLFVFYFDNLNFLSFLDLMMYQYVNNWLIRV